MQSYWKLVKASRTALLIGAFALTACGGSQTAQSTTVPATTAPTTAPATSVPTVMAPTTVPATIAPTAAPTTAPTIAPTAAPTDEPTTAPTDKPTTKPTTKPTAKPTEAATEAATTEATAEATTGTGGTGGGTGGGPVTMSSDPGVFCAGTFGFGASCLGADGWATYNEDSKDLGGDLVAAMTVCPDKSMYIAHTFGVSIFDGKKWSEIEEWGTGSAEDMTCDSKNNLWVAHYEGLSTYQDGKWTTYPSKDLATGESANDLVYSVAIANDGMVWAATSKSVASLNDGTWTVYQKGQGFDDDVFFDKVVIDGEGRPVVVSSSGLYVFEKDEWTAIKNPDYVTIEDVAVAPNGDLWVGTFADGIAVYNGKNWSKYTQKEGELSSNHVRSIAFDGTGRAWVGTAWGLNVWADDKWTTYRMENSAIADNDVYQVAVVDGGPAKLPALEEKKTGSISGMVQREDKTVLADAAVEICVESLGFSYDGPSPCSEQQYILKGKTDAEGKFMISDVPPGRYIVTMQTGEASWAQLTGEFSMGERTEVKAEEDTDLGELTIKPEEKS